MESSNYGEKMRLGVSGWKTLAFARRSPNDVESRSEQEKQAWCFDVLYTIRVADVLQLPSFNAGILSQFSVMDYADVPVKAGSREASMYGPCIMIDVRLHKARQLINTKKHQRSDAITAIWHQDTLVISHYTGNKNKNIFLLQVAKVVWSFRSQANGNAY